jgi:hypothetical protein
MPAPKKSPPRVKPLPVRLPAELVERIDRVKDPDATREKFVRRLIDEALTARARKAR